MSQTDNDHNITLTGTVVDRTGQPLYGATVHLQHTTHEVLTDRGGRFRFLTGQKIPAIVEVSFVGYETRVDTFNSFDPIRIQLQESANRLNDVVVVGYGTQRRKDLTSSISSVKQADVAAIPVASFDAQLQGKAPGLQINSNTGTPGDGVFVRIRGTTSINADNNPLYIIDGVFVNNTSLQSINTGGRETSPLADLNPADIENVEVLKDASATAIYGSRGANGVIIITTKRGRFNSPPKLSLDVSTGTNWAPKLWSLTTGPQHAMLENEFYENSYADAVAAGNAAGEAKYQTPPFTGSVWNPTASTKRGTPDIQKTYDRLDQLFRHGNLQNYNLSLSGGNKETQYYFGAGFTHQDADIRPLYFERGSFKFNLDQKVTDWLQVGTSNNFSRTYRKQGRAGDGPDGGLLQSALHTPTYLPPFDSTGKPLNYAGFDNLSILIEYYDVHTISLRYIGNFYAEAQLLPGLKFRTSWSLDYNNYNESQYWNNLTQDGAPPTNGLATSSLTQNTTWIDEQTLSYNTRLGGKNSIGLVIGNTLQSNLITNTSAQGTGFPNNSYTDISSAATRTASQSWTKGNLASFFGRFDYNYASKYFLEASFRADGSSKFGEDNKWGYFPSIGGSWRLKNESFLRNVKTISDLKLRASYGITGNQNGISNFAALGLWSGSSGYPDNASGDQPGTSPQQLANKDLKWERTAQANIGLDLGLFQDRITLNANIYNKRTTNVLLALPIPGVTGFTSYNSNAGIISNKGYEIGLSTVNLKTHGLTWTSNFSVSGNVNKVVYLPSPIYEYSRDWVVMQQGSPMYSFWLYKQLYVDPKTGASVFQGETNGTLPTSARQILGNAMPKFFGGFNNNFSYAGFDLGILFSYQYGNKVMNLNRFFGEGGGTRDANRVMFADQLNRWTHQGQVTDVPRETAYGLSYTTDQNSRFMEDGSFIRLKDLTVGYTLPASLTGKWKVGAIRLYFVGTNLWLHTKYTGPDPEANTTATQTIQGLDLGTPPQPRAVQFGINATI
ncbi:TonB-dependent receptor [Dinghuibacter sp.]|uniref:SusC/RagA family TonB-linked outer membrane protein n=1 Tax=Dinghuibacter sp. TaxID=2024697 RepID=UPI002D7E450B|nr:TonB-dependent receptor [Dinghuibacter sp.]